MKPTDTTHRVGDLTLACNGCCDTVTVPVEVKVRYDPISHRVVRSEAVIPTVYELAPTGWIVNDPYTHCTYCPECWQKVTQPEDTP